MSTTTQNEETADALLEFGRGVLQHIPVALTLLGIFFYGDLRWAYGLFYGKLGTTPEEVGLDYQEILAQSLVGLLGYFLFISGTILVVSLAAKRDRGACPGRWAEPPVGQGSGHEAGP